MTEESNRMNRFNRYRKPQLHPARRRSHCESAALGARLVFSAADAVISEEGAAYVPIEEQATRVWYRRGTGDWTALPLVIAREDAGAGGRPAAGFVFQADLAFLGDAPGYISLRAEVVDRSGNRSTWTLEPAVRLQPSGGRQRPARR